ncbi:hypothetical protein XJ44_05655 [Thermosipho affectus]|uniref:Uncharacterized protein n=1 Tax=Thermosipho affectus TaxID=660294 RepID=A0ABX3IIV2_9BACT|nr:MULTISPECIES: hypothetical protein [Thermosipho]ANQ53912.1 hypothetical protein Y592_05760 [Thermosipho sp. 1070]APT73054.1 hypothetical protein BG95_05680 [Thermosipho sp. 1063]ONN27263.1 hypothetical protein XJ44_05655 [Thermosipho affectus]OOC43602.1 hypothetical protein XO08_05560 [Thermosipho sp. 1074]
MKKIVFLFLFLQILSFAQILDFWVDPFFDTYGFSITQDIEFWKVKALLRYDINVNWEQGFPVFEANVPEIFFDLNAKIYSVEYGFFHRKVPFSVFVNPYEMGLNVRYGFTGFYNDYCYFSGNFLDVSFKEGLINVGLKYKDFRIFYEKFLEKNIFGIQIDDLIFFYDEYGLEAALYFQDEYFGLYFNPVNNLLGMAIFSKNNYLFITQEEMYMNVKWGEINVFGRFQKEKRKFAFGFKIW